MWICKTDNDSHNSSNGKIGKGMLKIVTLGTDLKTDQICVHEYDNVAESSYILLLDTHGNENIRKLKISD